MKKIAVLALLAGLTVAYASGRVAAAEMAGSTVWQTASQPGARSAAAAVAPFVVRAFRATGARVTGFEVHAWSTLADGFETTGTLRSRALSVARALGFTGLALTVHDGRADHVVVWKGRYTNPSLGGTAVGTVEFASMEFPGQKPQTVCVARILAATGTAAALAPAYADIAAAVAVLHGDTAQNATLFGDKGTPLGTVARAALARKALATARAKPIGRMTITYTTSVSAYAPIAVPTLPSGTQKIDLQVAFHENFYNKDTRVLVGSPIVTLEY